MIFFVCLFSTLLPPFSRSALESTQALEFFAQETIKIPFRDEQLEWVACSVGAAQPDLVLKGIFLHLSGFLRSQVNPFFSPLSPETPWRTDSSLTAVLDYMVSKRGSTLTSTLTGMLDPYLGFTLQESSTSGPAREDDTHRTHSAVYTTITLLFASPTLTSACLEGFLRCLRSTNLDRLVQVERSAQISKFQTFDEGFDAHNEK